MKDKYSTKLSESEFHIKTNHFQNNYNPSKSSKSFLASFSDSIFLVSNCLSITTSSFVKISFPTTNTNDKMAKSKITLTTFCCLTSDFLKVLDDNLRMLESSYNFIEFIQ